MHRLTTRAGRANTASVGGQSNSPVSPVCVWWRTLKESADPVIKAARGHAATYNKAHPEERPAHLRTPLSNGHMVHTWYDRQSRNWITHLFDAHGYEAGPSMYDGHKAAAYATHGMYVRDHATIAAHDY